jgi:transposase
VTDIPYAALIGIDWADQKHDICLYDCETQKKEYCVIGSRPEAIEAWALQLRLRYGGKPIAVCLEQKRGPLIYALCKYEFLVLFPVNPQTVAKYRHAFTPSRAKDDPTDAELQVELLQKHRDKLTLWKPASPMIRKLQALVEWRRTLVEEVGRTTNRLVDVLKGYFPQAIDCFEHRDTFVFCDFLTQWSSLNAVQQVSDEDLQQFFCDHHSRYKDCNARRIDCLRAAIPLTEDRAIVESSQIMVRALVSQLRSLLTSVSQFEHEIDQVFRAMPDHSIFASLPHAGDNLAPRLLLAFGEERSRYQSAQDILQYAGIAPVTERSGKKCWVHWRWSAPQFLRQTFIEWANESRKASVWAKAFYQAQKQAGKTHQEAIRSLAFKWIRIIFRCWKDRVAYDESKYIEALREKGSPLVKKIVQQS